MTDKKDWCCITPNSKYFAHYNLKMPDITFLEDGESYVGECTRKLLAEVMDKTDEVLVKAILKTAAEEGVTDLFLIDKDFIVCAIKNELIRRKEL